MTRPDVTYLDADNGMLTEVLCGIIGAHPTFFCRCGTCFDAPTTVELDARYHGKLLASETLCSECAEVELERLPSREGLVYELIDGRRLEWS